LGLLFSTNIKSLTGYKKKFEAIVAKSEVHNLNYLKYQDVKKILNNQTFIKKMQNDAKRCNLMQLEQKKPQNHFCGL
jgi:hypothetical protein